MFSCCPFFTTPRMDPCEELARKNPIFKNVGLILVSSEKRSVQGSGVCIDRNIVITAAHCVKAFSNPKIEFLIEDASGDMIEHEIFKFYPHPEHKPLRSTHDIAICSLKYPIPNVIPITMYTQLDLKSDCISVGFPGEKFYKSARSVGSTFIGIDANQEERICSKRSHFVNEKTTNGVVTKGMSGGGLFHSDQLVAINAAMTLLDDKTSKELDGETAVDMYASLAINKDWLNTTIDKAQKELLTARREEKAKLTTPAIDKKHQTNADSSSELTGLITGEEKTSHIAFLKQGGTFPVAKPAKKTTENGLVVSTCYRYP